MELSERIDLEEWHFFRLRVLYSLLSGSPIFISNIRPLDDDPGVKGLFIS
jgi:RNA 3'-terminal phosphate cyclase